MNPEDNINKRIPDEIEKIVAMDFFENSDKIAIAKIDNEYRLFIEIFDIGTNHKKIIHLQENIFINRVSLYYYDDYILGIWDDYNLIDEIKSSIKKFEYLSDNTFYLRIYNSNNGQNNYFNLIINIDGKIIYKYIDELNDKYKDSQERQLVFFDTNAFKEINHNDFFNDFFEKDSFWYNFYCMGDSISVDISSDKKRLGIWYFFKDEEEPRGNFSLFDITDFEIPKLIFSYKIDEYGNFKFSSDNRRIIYWHYEDNKGILISYTIRELDEFKFGQEKKVFIDYPNRFSATYDFGLINNIIIKIDYDKFQLHDISLGDTQFIYRNFHSPYCINSKAIAYINKYKLEIIKM